MNGEQVAELLEMMAEMARLHDGAQDEVAGIGAVVLAELPTILQHLRAQTGWRTMDSAPKDGTFVHLWVPADERSGGYSETGSWCKTANAWDIGAARQPDSMFTHWRPEFPPPGDAP